MAIVTINVDINKITVQVFNAPTFPPVPTRWTNRFDRKMWNEFETACNDALDQMLTNSTKKCTIVWIVSFFVFSTLAGCLLGGWLDSDDREYCCDPGHIRRVLLFGDYACDKWCDDYTSAMFISSMVFWSLAACALIFILPCGMCNDYNKLAKISTQERLQSYFKFLNAKYQNMVVVTVTAVNYRWCTCKCAEDRKTSTCGGADPYFEAEIELKVQAITYIDESVLLTSLPTQQQVANQQGVALTQQAVQPQSSASYGGDHNHGFQQKHYTQWTTNDVFDWMMQLDNGSFVMYQQQLSQTLNNEQIDGNNVINLDKDDLHRLGVKNANLKKSVLAHIQSLSSQPAPAYEDNPDMEPLVPLAPGGYNQTNIKNNANEGATTNM